MQLEQSLFQLKFAAKSLKRQSQRASRDELSEKNNIKKVSGNMASVVRGMDKAIKSMDLEQIALIMDKFESQFEDLDVQSSYMENVIGTSTAISTPQDEIDLLLQKVADEAGLELSQDLINATPSNKGMNEQSNFNNSFNETITRICG
ncbi:hypothetical protein PCK2_000273 [Pneumocystis canis]|nr:hypothetical protein PCK2_000273 [Pneumocystis canis]